MRFLIIHAHPDPASFNAALTGQALAELTRLGHEVEVSDLYAMNFQAVAGSADFPNGRRRNDRFRLQEEQLEAGSDLTPDILAEQAKLERADGVVLQFPIWWFSMPAIMRGWVDRVMTMGWAYGGSHGIYDKAGLRGRRAMLSVTTGGPESMWTDTGVNGRMEDILYPINHGILAFLGFEILPPFVAWQPARVPAEVRQAYLDAYAARLRRFSDDLPIPYPTVDMFDETWRLKPRHLAQTEAGSF
jgi:NAD(P)H dehydrogenase (quinone)